MGFVRISYRVVLIAVSYKKSDYTGVFFRTSDMFQFS